MSGRLARCSCGRTEPSDPERAFALVPQGEDQYVFRVVDGKAARTKVEVGQRRDGRVEALIGGDADAVAQMIAWARQGPPGVRVDHVAVELEAVPQGEFEQIPTV